VSQRNPEWVLTKNKVQRKKEQGLTEDWYKNIPAIFAPAGRILSPEEIAAAAVHWRSDERGLQAATQWIWNKPACAKLVFCLL